jgi:hypothetical protein
MYYISVHTLETVQNGCELKCNIPLPDSYRILLGIETPSLAKGVQAVILHSMAGENTDFLCHCLSFLISFSL